MEVDLLNITKSYARNTVVNDVSMKIESGTIHGLVGENGAGKSTLMKILIGVEYADNGSVLVEGKTRIWKSPLDARNAGIAMVFQELSLVPALTVVENMFLGQLFRKASRTVDWPAMQAKAQSILSELDPEIDCGKRVDELQLAQQQLVEIARALAQQARLIILDEPTSALSENEARKLFDHLRNLRDKGVAIVFITHRLQDVFQICQHVTILRDGALIRSCPIAELDMDAMIADMVGREMNEQFPKRETDSDISQNPVALEVRGAGDGVHFREVSFSVRKGEILGFAGLAGSGRTELLEAIFGAADLPRGEITLFGKALRLDSPTRAVRAGLGLIADDRKTKSLVLDKEVDFNLNMSSQHKYATRWGRRIKEQEKHAAHRLSESLHLKTTGLDQFVLNLSGGNQQKVAIGKTLNSDASVLIFDEPTRGVDVGAKREIYFLLRRLAQQGTAIILISSELEEILGLSDRIVVLHDGRIAGELDAADATQEEIVRLAVGA